MTGMIIELITTSSSHLVPIVRMKTLVWQTRPMVLDLIILFFSHLVLSLWVKMLVWQALIMVLATPPNSNTWQACRAEQNKTKFQMTEGTPFYYTVSECTKFRWALWFLKSLVKTHRILCHPNEGYATGILHKVEKGTKFTWMRGLK